mmetsp:Transcript_20677/g.43168  ORF Transcript_20677/g.43168 Transcript_20677/m.43168 type:complete len:1109 (+) Transcript_20677:196-3522(+)
MANAVPPPVSNDNVRTALQIHSELDRNAFQEICNRLLISDDGNSPTIPTNVVAAVLAITVKGLASPPDAYLTSNTSLSGDNTTPIGGLRGLVMNYVRFQSQFGNPGSSSTAPVASLTHVAKHCSNLVTKWNEGKESTILGSMHRYFLEHAIPAGSVEENPAENNPTTTPSDMESFAKLLSNTLDCMCLTTTRCLEDLMDFDFLWASTFNDPGITDTPLFGIDGVSKYTYWENVADSPSLKQYQCPKCLKEFHFKFSKTAAASFSRHVKACDPEEQPKKDMKKKRKSAMITPESIRQVAKNLAWTFSRTAYSFPSNTDDAIINTKEGYSDRKHRIINAVACIDIVAAAMMAPIISAPAKKRRRLQSGDINPQISVEDESAAALRPMLNDSSNELKDLREKSKESLLRATADLLSAVTDERRPIVTTEHKHIVSTAQKVASSVLPFLTENCAGIPNTQASSSSPASHLLSFISSHQLRERNLRVMKEGHHRALSGGVQAILPNTSLPILKEQKALAMGWIICKLQRTFFIDAVNEFGHLNFTERKFLAPFASSHTVPSYQGKQDISVRAIIHTQKILPSKSPEKERCRHAIQISRVKNPPTTEAELKDLNEWTTNIYNLVTASSSIKPSHWLKSYLQPSTTSICNGIGEQNGGKTAVFPVLNCFLAIVAKDGSIDSGTCAVSDAGEYKVQKDDVTPGAALQLYYVALELIVRRSPNTMLIINERFHSSLFSLCYFCLQTAANPEGRCFLIEDIGDCTTQFHYVVEVFIQVMKPGSESVTTGPLPSYMIQILHQLQEMLLGMIWMAGYSCLGDKVQNTFAGMVNNLKENPATWLQTCLIKPSADKSSTENSREEMLVGYMLRNLVNVIQRRVSKLCELLLVPSATTTTNQTMKVFTTMLHHRTDMFFDRHPDQMMLCCIYTAMCLKSKVAPAVSFHKITEAYIEMNRDRIGSEISYAIVHRIKNCSGQDDQFGDIISLFNEVFVPNVKPFWRSFKDGQQAEESSNPSKSPTDSRALETEMVASMQCKHSTMSKEESNRTDYGIDMDIEKDPESKRNSTHQREANSALEIGNGEGLNQPVLNKIIKDDAHGVEECSRAESHINGEHEPSKVI